MTKQGQRIFISYAREDATEMALRLRNDLAAAGHDVWLDLAEIAAGASWAKDIEEAIEQCQIAITLMSQGAYVSDICRGEQLRALRKHKRVIPVLIQANADRPLHLEHLNYVDFSSPGAYKDRLADLLTYITTGQLPANLEIQPDDTDEWATRPLPPIQTQPVSEAERKRDTRAFRRYIADLRDEPWLGERHWWTYFLFYFAEVQTIAEVLQLGYLEPKQNRRTRWDDSVRLYFRPRTPDLFGCEGIRPAAQQPSTHCPVPVYLLFDLESVLTLPETRFSEGDIVKTKKTFKAASAFRDMPFDLIYHDTWVPREKNDRGERGEILGARRAQVFVPEALDLSHLRHVMCRSQAEAETLLNLLPERHRRQWREIVRTHPDYKLFNDKWVYVKEVMLSLEGAYFRFNPCDEPDCEMMNVRVAIQPLNSKEEVIELGEMTIGDDLSLDLTNFSLNPPFELRLYLDDALAYCGYYSE